MTNSTSPGAVHPLFDGRTKDWRYGDAFIGGTLRRLLAEPEPETKEAK